MDRVHNSQKSATTTHRARQLVASRADLALRLPERLALYAFGVGCLLACLLESPVPMAIAP